MTRRSVIISAAVAGLLSASIAIGSPSAARIYEVMFDGGTITQPLVAPAVLLTQAPGEPPPGITGTDPLVLSQSKYGFLKLTGGVGVPGLKLPEMVVTGDLYLGESLSAALASPGAMMTLTDISGTSPVPLVLGPADDEGSVRLTAGASGQLTIDRPVGASPAALDLSTGTVTARVFSAAGHADGAVYAAKVYAYNGNNASALLVPPSVTATFAADPGDLTQTVSLIPAKSLVLGVSGEVNVPATGCALVNVGDATDEDRYAALFDVTTYAAFGPHNYAPELHWRSESMPGDVVVTGYAADGTTPAACIDLQLRLSAHVLQFNTF